MKKLLKPANIGFYILMALFFFIVGLYFAGLIGAGKNQGLAGGAIVLGYGILFSGVAFLASFFVAYYSPHKIIVRCNWTLLLLLVMAYGITHYRYLQRMKKEEAVPETTLPKRTATEPTARLTSESFSGKQSALASKADSIGLGFFKHDFHSHPTLYFYGSVQWEKGISEHVAQDSLALHRNETGSFDLVAAPPYVWPEYNRSDFGILYFKVLAVGYDFIQVVVNSKTGQTAYLDKHKGQLLFWPEFVLKLNEVSLSAGNEQPIRLKPLDFASKITTRFHALRPIAATGQWLRVALLNDQGQTIDRGWIKWQNEGRMLVEYQISH